MRKAVKYRGHSACVSPVNLHLPVVSSQDKTRRGEGGGRRSLTIASSASAKEIDIERSSEEWLGLRKHTICTTISNGGLGIAEVALDRDIGNDPLQLQLLLVVGLAKVDVTRAGGG